MNSTDIINDTYNSKEENILRRQERLHTDLALEEREKFQDDVEVSGVALNRECFEDNMIIITTVDILNEHGAQVMGKAKGTYVTIEAPDMENDEKIAQKVSEYVAREIHRINKKINMKKVIVAGLGNREVTPDMLGPMVTDELYVTNHIYAEFGSEAFDDKKPLKVCAIAPGVMAQTGMETKELIKGIAVQINPDCVFVIDALAARSVSRLNTTIQLTDTGISPGSGVGNHRNAINSETIGVPVIAIGVPTVVDAFTIINDSMEKYLEGIGMTKQEISSFMNGFAVSNATNMIVTPKNIDESVENIARVIASALNSFIASMHI